MRYFLPLIACSSFAFSGGVPEEEPHINLCSYDFSPAETGEYLRTGVLPKLGGAWKKCVTAPEKLLESALVSTHRFRRIDLSDAAQSIGDERATYLEAQHPGAMALVRAYNRCALPGKKDDVLAAVLSTEQFFGNACLSVKPGMGSRYTLAVKLDSGQRPVKPSELSFR